MPFFGSDWNDDYDGGPIGISSSMKEDCRRERETELLSSSGLGHIGFQPLDVDSNSTSNTK